MKIAKGEGQKQRSDLQSLLDEMSAERERILGEKETLALQKSSVDAQLEQRSSELAASKKETAWKTALSFVEIILFLPTVRSLIKFFCEEFGENSR